MTSQLTHQLGDKVLSLVPTILSALRQIPDLLHLASLSPAWALALVKVLDTQDTSKPWWEGAYTVVFSTLRQ